MFINYRGLNAHVRKALSILKYYLSTRGKQTRHFRSIADASKLQSLNRFSNFRSPYQFFHKHPAFNTEPMDSSNQSL